MAIFAPRNRRFRDESSDFLSKLTSVVLFFASKNFKFLLKIGVFAPNQLFMISGIWPKSSFLTEIINFPSKLTKNFKCLLRTAIFAPNQLFSIEIYSVIWPKSSFLTQIINFLLKIDPRVWFSWEIWKCQHFDHLYRVNPNWRKSYSMFTARNTNPYLYFINS